MESRLSYEELDVIVLAYRNGEPDASAALLKAFEGFLVKFRHLVVKGQVDLKDRTLRNFLCLFITDPDKKSKAHQYQHILSVRSELVRMAGIVRDRYRILDGETVWQELVVALLSLARNYKLPDKGGPRFHAWVTRVFHWQVFRQLQKLISDPTCWEENVSFDEAGHSSSEGEFLETNPGLLPEDNLDEGMENWVLGMTSGERFTHLGTLERRILALYYLGDFSDQAVAEKLGLCRATVNRRRLNAVKQLTKEA